MATLARCHDSMVDGRLRSDSTAVAEVSQEIIRLTAPLDDPDRVIKDKKHCEALAHSR